MCVWATKGALTDGTWRGCVVGGCSPPFHPSQKDPAGGVCGGPYQALKTKQEISCACLPARCADWLVLAHLLDSSHRTHFPGLLRQDRLRELISRAYLAELVDPNSADEDVLNSSFKLIRYGRPQLIFRRRIQDIFSSSHKDVLNSSSARLPKTCSQDDLRMSDRDVSCVRPSDTYSGHLYYIVNTSLGRPKVISLG